MDTWKPQPLWLDNYQPAPPQSVQPIVEAPYLPREVLRELMSPDDGEPRVRCYHCRQMVRLRDARKGKDLYGTWFSDHHWYDKMCAKALVTLRRISLEV